MRNTIVVVENPANWGLEIPDVPLVAARDYLTDKKLSQTRSLLVFNLCRSYRYQSVGYYVSLLAEARGHKPIPDVTTIQDLKTPSISRIITGDLEELVQRSLAPIKGQEFVLSIYFGQNLAKRYDRLSSQLFRLFEAPLLRAQFIQDEKWELKSITAIAASEIPEEHRDFVNQSAREYLTRKRRSGSPKNQTRYDLAILWDPRTKNTASDEKAIRRFEKAAETLGISTEIITRSDFGRIAEFDALFIRDTTNVHHYTYRFARRATAEGLIAIDDPESILRCTNKVYLAELMSRHKIPAPKTLVVNKASIDEISDQLGFPCILKQPDSSFSQGVTRVDNRDQLKKGLDSLLARSELVIAQEYIPTDFDWRVGIIDRKPLYVCQYFMAPKHWQIIHNKPDGRFEVGRVKTIPVSEAPEQVVSTALKAANLIGSGFYGVDLKQVGGQTFVIEVNDNPSIDGGEEDASLKDELYLRIMSVFVERLDRIKGRES